MCNKKWKKNKKYPKKIMWSNYAKNSLEILNFAKMSNTDMKQFKNDYSYISIKIEL